MFLIILDDIIIHIDCYEMRKKDVSIEKSEYFNDRNANREREREKGREKENQKQNYRNTVQNTVIKLV